MDNLDFLIPAEIIDLCQFDKFTMEIKLESTPARGVWPCVKVLLNDEEIFNGVVVEEQYIHNTRTVNGIDEFKLSIHYYNKTDNDTVVHQGTIIENQSLTIKNILINDINLIQTNIIYAIGCYTLNLTDNKKAHFLKNGIDIGPSHSLGMYENGHWDIILKTPLVPYFTKIRTAKIQYNNWPNHSLMNQIYQATKILGNRK
jgi:hypothetical protein